MERTRVRIVDDLAYTQQGLRELLELGKNLEVELLVLRLQS